MSPRAQEPESPVREGRRGPFKQLPDAVIDNDELSPQAKIGYWYLKRIAGYGDDLARVSMSTIAKKMGYAKASKRSARERLDELVRAGWIDIYYRKSSDGKENLPSEYVVHEIPEPPGVGAGQHPGVGAGGNRGGCWAAPGSVLGGTGVLEGSSLEGSSLEGKSKPSADADATTGDASASLVQARGAQPATQPSTTRAPAPGAVETNTELADDLGRGADVVDLFGGPAAKPAKKTRKRATDDPDRDRNAGDVVKAWVDGYRTTGNEPLGRRCAQVGKEAKELLAAGNDVGRLIEAATQAGKQGWFSLERQLTAAARVANYRAPNRIRDFKSPEDQTEYDKAW